MKGKRKIVILSLLAAMMATLIGVGGYYWYNSTYYVSTEDAQVTGDFFKVTPQISGRLLEFDAKEGERVVKDQILGHVEAIGGGDSSIDTSLFRAPITGIIIKKQGEIGEMDAAGSTLAVLIDPSKLYINANIEETKIKKLKIGQNVDIKIDQYKGEKFKGKVEQIGLASNAAFSLLPSSSSGTFTKVVEKVPVKIKLEKYDVNLLPATNAVVKIRVK